MSKIEEIYQSDLDEDAYTSKPGDVYLAFVDAPVKESDKINIEDTVVGGDPLWLHAESIPSEDMLRCGACKSVDNMRLLLQAFSPLDVEQVQEIQEKNGINSMDFINGDDDRVLYVFLCTKCPRKGNSIRCIRGVKKNESSGDFVADKMAETIEGKDFKINPFDLSNSNENIFGSNPFLSGATSQANPFAASEKPVIAVDANKNAKPSIKAARKLHDSQKDKEFDAKKLFKSYLLYVEEESFKNKEPDHLKLPKNLKIDKDALDLTSDLEESIEKNPIKLDPRTEKLSKFLDDDVFQKFQEVVGYNPHQVLRYEFGGRPLLYAETKINLEKTVPNPTYNPSSKRVFEMQLMPKLILDLEEDISIEESMEWGTILIFSDIANYIPKFDENNVGYVEECVKVQWETRE